MLNRRYLRIKIMQALYGWFRDESGDIKVSEKNLFSSIDKTYELFLYLVSFLSNLHFCAGISIEDGRAKKLPSKEDLNPNNKFISNKVLLAIAGSKPVTNELSKKGVGWQNDQDLVRKILSELKGFDFYKEYMQSEEHSFNSDRLLIKNILSEHLSEHELFNFWFEDRNIHWSDDLYFAFVFLNKWLDGLMEGQEPRIPKLFRDEDEDRKFVSDLFCKTIIHSTEFNVLIEKHTKNWELERIATIDILLMKMTLTEIMYLSNIPIKVSMNEYIDLAKEYSTPQSGRFINGVMDKIVLELKQEEKILKTGRGLLET